MSDRRSPQTACAAPGRIALAPTCLRVQQKRHRKETARTDEICSDSPWLHSFTDPCAGQEIVLAQSEIRLLPEIGRAHV